MTTAKDRILIFLEYLGIGQNAFEKKCGISNGYISNSRGSFGSKIVAKISATYPDLNTSWLLTGEGEMLKPANPFTRMPLEEMRVTLRDTIAEELLKLLKKGEIYLAPQHEKLIAEKNAEIAKRDAVIEELRKVNWELQRKLEESKE